LPGGLIQGLTEGNEAQQTSHVPQYEVWNNPLTS